MTHISGLAATGFLNKFYPEIIDTGFTANMENTLDAIAHGKADRVSDDMIILLEKWPKFMVAITGFFLARFLPRQGWIGVENRKHAAADKDKYHIGD